MASRSAPTVSHDASSPRKSQTGHTCDAAHVFFQVPPRPRREVGSRWERAEHGTADRSRSHSDVAAPPGGLQGCGHRSPRRPTEGAALCRPRNAALRTRVGGRPGPLTRRGSAGDSSLTLRSLSQPTDQAPQPWTDHIALTWASVSKSLVWNPKWTMDSDGKRNCDASALLLLTPEMYAKP